MSTQPMILPPLQPYPATVAGIPVALPERRFATYQSAFVSEFLEWLDRTELHPDDVQDHVDTLLSAIRQIHELHKLKAPPRGPYMLGDVINKIVDELIAKNGATETAQ